MRASADGAINSIIDIMSVLAVTPYVQLSGLRIITPAEAAEALRRDADMVAKMDVREPLVTDAVARKLRDYAKCFDRERDTGRPPSLTLLRGGLSEGSEGEPS